MLKGRGLRSRRPCVPSQGCTAVSRIRVLLADDHPQFSELAETLLESTFEVVGKVGDGRALFHAALKLKPDIIVTDISMPLLNGIEAAKSLKGSGCTSPVVFLTAHGGGDFIHACLAAGGLGFVTKRRMATDLIRAIREALRGHIFVSPLATSATG